MNSLLDAVEPIFHSETACHNGFLGIVPLTTEIYRILDDLRLRMDDSRCQLRNHVAVDPVEKAPSVLSLRLLMGLAFRVPLWSACDDEIVPLQERMETVYADLEEVYNTERRLLSAGSLVGDKCRSGVGVLG